MKLFLLLVFTCVTSMRCLSQNETPRNVPSTIQHVVVYMSGAELHHAATVRLTQGKQELVFKGLSSQLQEQTLVVDIQKKDITILSVTSRINYMDPVKNNERIIRVQDSLMAITEKFNLYENRINTLLKEKDILFKNEAIGGTSQGVMVAEIVKAADFYRQRMFDIDDQITLYRKQKTESSNLRNRLEQQLVELNATYNPPTSEVTIVVMSPSATETDFSIKYQVANAGWTPKYDVRSDGIGQPIELTYRANIFNNCGSDWNNVKLKLSTADPNQGAEKPTLQSWDLGSIDVNYDRVDRLGYSIQEIQLEEVEINAAYDWKGKDAEQKKVPGKNQLNPMAQPNVEIIEVSELSAEFEIEQRYTILSDAKPYIVEVSKHQLDGKYEHFAVPKMDVDAFLVAKVSGWNALNLVSGKASVYYSGTYLGDSYINTASVEDTLVLSMGRDKKLSIVRNKKTEASKKVNSGNSVKESFVFETSLKNNREVPVLVNMEDQLPISSDKEIQVTEEEISGGTLDKFNGKINYQIVLQPGETKKITLAYSVKSPQNRAIRGSRNVRRSRTKF